MMEVGGMGQRREGEMRDREVWKEERVGRGEYVVVIVGGNYA
jgi:hypothetical protein